MHIRICAEKYVISMINCTCAISNPTFWTKTVKKLFAASERWILRFSGHIKEN